MKKIVSAALAAGLALGAAGVATAPAAQAAVGPAKLVTTTCADIVLLGVAGSGERTDAKIKEFGGYGETVRNVLNRIESDLKASSYRTTRVTTFKKEALNYPAAGLPTKVTATEVTNYVKSADTGVTKLRDRIAHYRKTCPSAKVVVVGYSQGAWVTHAALASFGTNTDVVRNVKATILLADPNNDTSVMYGNLVNSSGKHVWESQWDKIKGLGTAGESALRSAATVSTTAREFWLAYQKAVTKIDRLRPGRFSSLLKDQNRTVSFCANRDPLCSFGFRTIPGITAWTAHSSTYKTSAVAGLVSAYVTPRVMPSSGNGACDPGEMCAYTNASRSRLVLDSAKIGGTKVVTGFARDSISSVWNRSMYRWAAVNKRTSRPDERLVVEPLQYHANLATLPDKIKWNDAIDHFDVLRD